MPDAQYDITLKAKIEADISDAERKLAQLQALGAKASTAEAGPQSKSSVAKDIADQIAALKRLKDQQIEVQKSEGLKGTELKQARANAARSVKAVLENTLAGVDRDIAREVRGMVGSRDKLKTYLARQDTSAADLVAAKPPPMTAEGSKMKELMDLRSKALAGGRANEAFMKSVLGLDTETKRFAAAAEQGRLGSIEYQKAAVDAAIAFKRGGATLLQSLTGQREFNQATADATAARKTIAQQAAIVERGGKFEDLQALTPAQLRDRYASVTGREKIEDRTRQVAAAAEDPGEVALRAQYKAASAKLNARVVEAANATQGYVEDQARSRLANREVQNKLKAYAAGYTDEDIAQRGGAESAAATATFVMAQRRRGQVAASITDEEIAIAAQERAAMAGVNNAIKLREKEILKEMIQSGELGGSYIQRKMALWSPGLRTPADFAMGAENIKAKAFTTLGYGVSAIGTAALFTGVTDTLKDASKLQMTFVRMQDQMKALGREGDFSEIRSGIKGIATDTGVMATDVAEFSSRMFGVFGKDAQGNMRSTADIMKETSDAMKLMVVSGIDARTMMQSVIPVAKSFGVSVGEIGNAAVEVGELVGISEEQVIQFLGKSATVAKESGLQMRELAIIGATMGQNLGKPLDASADVFNKMPALVQKNQTQIADILRSSPVTAPLAERMQEALGQGKPGQALIHIIRAAALDGGLSTNALKDLPRLIANPREIEEATAIIQNARATVAKLDDAGFITANGTDALENRFQKLKDTVTQTLERIERAVEGLGESLFNLGLADVFTELGKTAEMAFGAINMVASAVGGLNDLTKSLGLQSGLINPLLRFGVQAAVITKALSLLVGMTGKLGGRGGLTGQAAGGLARLLAPKPGPAMAAPLLEASSIAAQTAAAKAVANLPAYQVAGPKAFISPPAAAQVGASLRGYQRAPGFVDIGYRSAQFEGFKNVTVGTLPGGGEIVRRMSIENARLMALQRATQETIQQNAIRAAQQQTAMYQLGQLGSNANQASWISRAFSGGSTSKWSPLRNATAGANEAVTQAGGTPGIVGSGMLLPALGITLAAGAAVYSTVQNQKGYVDQAADSLREQMKTADRKKLQEIIDAKTSLWDEFVATIFHRDTPEQMARAGIAYQDALEGRENLAGLDKIGALGTLEQQLAGQPSALERLTEFFNRDKRHKQYAAKIGLRDIAGNKVDQEWAGNKGQFQVRAEDVKPIIEAARAADAAGDKELASNLVQLVGVDLLPDDLKASARAGRMLNKFEADLEKNGGPQAVITKDFDAIKRDYQAGRIGGGDFLVKARERLQQAKDDLARNIKDDEYRKQQQQAVDQMEIEVQQAENAAVEARFNAMSTRISYSGRTDIEGQIAALSVATLPQYTKQEQIAKIPEVIGQLEKAFQEELEGIADPVQRARRAAQGFKIPESVQQLEIEAELGADTTVSPQIGKLAAKFGTDAQTLTARIAEVVLKQNVNVVDAVNKLFRERRKKLAEAIPEGIQGIFKKNEAQSEIESGFISQDEIDNLINLGGAPVQQLLGGASGFFNLDMQGMGKLALEKAQEWDVSTAEAFKRLLIERRDAILAKGEDATFINGLIDAIGGAFGQVAKPDPPEVAFQKARDARRKILADVAAGEKAAIEGAALDARGDPLVQANAELNEALKDYGVEAQLMAENLGDKTALQEAANRVKKARQAVEDARREQALIKFDWQEFNAGDDKRGQAQARLDKARAELAYAIADAGGNMQAAPVQRALLEVAKKERELGESTADNVMDRVRAYTSLQQAIYERDPVKVAQLALDQARAAVENAKTDAERTNAIAERIKAEHSLEDAISAVFASRAQLAIALAEAAGDPVRAAELQAKEAKRKLDEAIAQGRGEAEVNQLRGEYATATENWARSGRTNEEAIIDFQLQMGKITTAQAIESLKLILSRTREGTDEYRQLALKIRSLEQEAGQDNQFNLPSQIHLPTLYEARRMTQSTAMGIGYMDNRNISLQFNVNGAQDPSAVAKEITTAMQGALGGGQIYTPAVVAGGMN